MILQSFFCLSPTRKQHDMTLLLYVHDRPLYPMIPTYDRYCIYILYVNIYIYVHSVCMYMNRGMFFLHNAIDGVFLPCSPVQSRVLGSDLVLQFRTYFE